MKTSEHTNELFAALSKAQGDMEGASKDKENPHFRSKYADLGAVWEAIRKPLSDNGLSIVQWPRVAEDGWVECETVLCHSSGQWMSDTFAVPVTKADAQGYGAATTYARRFSLMAAAGIAPVDDDGNSAVGSPDTKPLARKQPPKNGAPKAEADDNRTPAEKAHAFIRAAESHAKLLPIVNKIIAHQEMDDAEKAVLLDRCSQRATELPEDELGGRAALLSVIAAGMKQEALA